MGTIPAGIVPDPRWGSSLGMSFCLEGTSPSTQLASSTHPVMQSQDFSESFLKPSSTSTPSLLPPTEAPSSATTTTLNCHSLADQPAHP